MAGKTKVLIVEDHAHIAELITLILEKEGFDTKEVNSGGKAVDAFTQYSPHLVILDVMLPELDGYGVLREIRRVSNVPVIMLTAKGETFDKVLGLEMGADDYIVKPFESMEFVARIKAVLRRYDKKTGAAKPQTIVFPNLTIDPETFIVTYHDQTLELPPKEFELLHYLAQNPNKVFTRDQLLDRIWGYDFVGESRTVDVHVKRLREKFTEEDSWSIKTVWGVGYKLETKA